MTPKEEDQLFYALFAVLGVLTAVTVLALVAQGYLQVTS